MKSLLNLSLVPRPQAINLSGVMALFFCGVMLSHYNSYNLSKHSQIASEHMFKALGVMAEFLVFLYMGMGFFTGRFKRWNFVFILFATIFCLLARALNIFPISFLANLGRRQKIPFKMQVSGWAGSRLRIRGSGPLWPLHGSAFGMTRVALGTAVDEG